MLKQTTIALAISATTALLSACQVTDSASDAGNTSLAIQSTAVKSTVPKQAFFTTGTAQTSAVEAPQASTALSIPVVESSSEVGTLTLTKAWISLDEVEIEKEEVEGIALTEEQQNQQDEIEFDGPFFINLITNESIPSIPSIDLLPGEYEEIELEIEVADEENGLSIDVPADAPELANYSLVLEGQYVGLHNGVSNQTIDFKLHAAIDEEIELKADPSKGLIIDADTMNNLIIAFRLRQWFAFTNSGEFSTSALSNDGHILLDSAVDAENSLLKLVLENIKDSADFGEDSDDDGELSSEEDDDDDSQDELDD